MARTLPSAISSAKAASGLVQRRGAVVVVALVQVDAVGLQPAQGIVHGRADPGAAEVAGAAFGRAGHVGMGPTLVAISTWSRRPLGGQPLADQRFRLTAGVAGHPA
jgi:hypothetical protein